MFSEGLYDGMSVDGDNTLIQYRFESILGENRPVLQMSVNFNCDPAFVNYLIDPC